MFGDIFGDGGEVSKAVFKHTEYIDNDGYTVTVLSEASAGSYSVPWWSWLVLGGVLLIILVCCMGWGMGLAGESTVRYRGGGSMEVVGGFILFYHRLPVEGLRQCELCQDRVRISIWDNHKVQCIQR